MSPRVLVFDLGGTLMEYVGMPFSWVDFYPAAFRRVAQGIGLSLTESQLSSACRVMEAMNPRISGRQKEIPPEEIMALATKSWHTGTAPTQMLTLFFEELHLVPHIFSDAIPVLKSLRQKGFRLAALTDLPTAMPDAFFRRHIPTLLPLLDDYVSSATCGWRKPHPAGLQKIARQFSVDVSQLIFIGDEEKDIQTAQNAGCRAVLLSRKGDGARFGQEKTFENLIQLQDWIG